MTPSAALRRAFMLGALALAATAAPVAPAAAHHGWGGYEPGLDMTAEITAIRLGNPHDRMTVVDGEGREWNLVLAPRTRNRRFGFGEDTFAVGDAVRVVGDVHPTRLESKVHQIWRDDELIYEYMYSPGVNSLERLGRNTPEENGGTN